MDVNTSSIMDTDLVDQHMRIINFILSFTGLGFNFFLIILFIFVNRRQCATYFLLLLMTICDFLYCTVYISIILTVDQYINIINHQIMCPLSFFLTPFTFTGSTLLLFICLLHFLTNYVRKYDTILGQIGGRLSVVFVLAFIIIRSVLSTTSVELITPDPTVPKIKICTVVMNVSVLVETVQYFNLIFTEITDILVYLGWVIVLLIYSINLILRKRFSRYTQPETQLSSIDAPLSFTSLIAFNNHHHHHHHPGRNSVSVPIELSDPSNNVNEVTIPTNKERHSDVSLIIVSISLMSILLYLPIMINKYSTMYYVYRKEALLNYEQTYFLHIIQQTAHLFCLSIRFIPYFIFDKRIHIFLNQMIGMKCMKIERRRTLSRKARYKIRHKYIFHFQCHRGQDILQLSTDDNHPET